MLMEQITNYLSLYFTELFTIVGLITVILGFLAVPLFHRTHKFVDNIIKSNFFTKSLFTIEGVRFSLNGLIASISTGILIRIAWIIIMNSIGITAFGGVE